MTRAKAIRIIEAAGITPEDAIVDIADAFIFEAGIESDTAHAWALDYAE